jgi:hypothetical protein
MGTFGAKAATAVVALGIALSGQAAGPAAADTPDGVEADAGATVKPGSRGSRTAPARSVDPRSGGDIPPAYRTAPTRGHSPGPEVDRLEVPGPAAGRPGPSAGRAVEPAPAADAGPPSAPAGPPAWSPPAVAPAAAPSAAVAPAAWSAPAAVIGPAIAAVPAAAVPAIAPVGLTGPAERRAATAAHALSSAVIRFAQLLDSLTTTLPGSPANPVKELLAGALLLVRRTLLPGLPTVPMVTVGNALVPEGTAGEPQTAAFTVTLKHAYSDEVAVRYATTDGTATAGADYTPVTGLLVFAPGETAKTLSVNIIPDSTFEEDQAFGLAVYPSGGPGWLRKTALASGTATIVDLVTAGPSIGIAEIDSLASPLAIRVDPTQQTADGIKVDAGTTFTLTLPGPTSSYTVVANKPTLLDIGAAGDQLTVTAKTPGFLGLAITAQDGSASRYLGLYVADPVTHLVPDTVAGYLPVGSITANDAVGDKFLQDFNFRDGVAPIDYLYIYDQGGADYTDGNLRGLLTQAVRHGLVPVVVFYNIQAVNNAAGRTGITEGENSAYQAINDYNWSDSKQVDKTMFTGYMKRYFTKLAADFDTMNRVGVPVQVVMEPDFLGYMAANKPAFEASAFVPSTDRTLNTAKVSSMYDAGLLTRGVDPAFPDTLAGMVQAINYYTGAKTPNIRLGWKTNIWAVPDQRVYSLGILHVTDKPTYPWQKDWGTPIGWDKGRPFIEDQASQLGLFLKKVGVTTWTGNPARAPFLAIDKYGVDGAYTYDPDMLNGGETAVLNDMQVFISGAYNYLASASDADIQKYFGLSKADFKTVYERYGGDFRTTVTKPEVRAVLTTLQNAAKADPNIAKWFFNADQWNNYLFLVKTLSTTLDGTKVMLWQIPQGHINGSTTLSGRDLSNSFANFEDSAATYFFGDTFTATEGRLAHFSANQAGDLGVTVSGNTVTWGEHMTMATQAGAMSVLFGAGLGISTRGSVTPAGGITDFNYWSDKATAYLSAVV